MKYLLLLSLTLLTIGCGSDDNPAGTSKAGEIIPLKIGNSWTLDNFSFDTFGNQIGLVESSLFFFPPMKGHGDYQTIFDFQPASYQIIQISA